MIDKISMLSQILEQNPDDAFARYGLAMEYANQNETAAAITQFDLLLARHADYTAGYFMAAQTLQRAGRSNEAKERLQLGIASAQRAGNSHALAEMQAALGDLEAENG